jgi:hypothetical protein
MNTFADFLQLSDDQAEKLKGLLIGHVTDFASACLDDLNADPSLHEPLKVLEHIRGAKLKASLEQLLVKLLLTYSEILLTDSKKRVLLAYVDGLYQQTIIYVPVVAAMVHKTGTGIKDIFKISTN